MTPFLRLVLTGLVGCSLTASAQLVETDLELHFNAARDAQNDMVWIDEVSGTTSLSFSSMPVRNSISTTGSTYPALTVAYATPASGLNGYFEAGYPIRSTADATFELWFHVSSLTAGADQVIFEAGGAGRGFSFVLSNATLSFNVDGALDDFTVSTPVSLGWHHVVGTITNTNDNTANDSIELYLDGTSVGAQSNLKIDDWSGGNIAGVGAAGDSVTGVTAPQAFHGAVGIVRFYNDRVLSGANIANNNVYFRERITTYVTGQYSSTNFNVTSAVSFTPTRTRIINGTLYGFDIVRSDGTGGLAPSQFIRCDLYSSADNGGSWTFIKTIIDNTHADLTNTKFESIKLEVTPAGYVALYAKNLYAVVPSGATDQRKFLTCIFSETPTGTYTVAFNERPYGEPSGDLGIVKTGGQLYIVSANTTGGYINIFNVGSRGDSLVAHTLNRQWLLPDNSIDHREAPSVFWRDGYFFMTTSGRTGWRPNQHKYAWATSLGGPWSEMVEFGDATGYHSQLFFVAFNGSNIVFSATRNAPQWGGEGGSRPVWLPLVFNRVPDQLATNYYDEVEINATTGTVEGFHYNRGRQLTISAASIVGASTNIAAVIDGDESTYWENGNDSALRTIDLTLSGNHQVKALKFKPYDEWRFTYKVKIYVGDGTTFTQVFPQGSEPPIIPNYAFLGPVSVTPATGSVVRIENYETYREGDLRNNFGLFEVQVWGDTDNAGYELNATFEAANLGAAGWSIPQQGAGTTAEIVTAPGTGSLAAKLTDNNTSTRVQVQKTFPRQNGSQVVVQWNQRTGLLGGGEYIRVFDGGVIAFDLLNDPVSGQFAQTDNNWVADPITSVSTDTWYHFRLEINTDTDTFDLYRDGQLVWLGGKLRNPVNGVDKIMFGTSAQATGTVSFFDNITIDGPNP